MTTPAAAATASVPFLSLDTLWLQVGGTICNLACSHCFISCNPTNHTHEMMGLGEVVAFLDEAERLGVRDYGVTGGEPFLNREIFEILEAIVARGPALVLTNGMLVTPAKAARLARLARQSEYSLDVRISFDAPEEAANDAIRGRGAFRKGLEGMRNLAGAGFQPGIAVTRVDEATTNEEILESFGALLRANGVARTRVKIFEPWRIGAEAARTRGYAPDERVTPEMMEGFAPERLQCSTSRIATARGVWVCPILVNEDRARMGSTIAETLTSFPLYSGACWTCHRFGASCRV